MGFKNIFELVCAFVCVHRVCAQEYMHVRLCGYQCYRARLSVCRCICTCASVIHRDGHRRKRKTSLKLSCLRWNLASIILLLSLALPLTLGKLSPSLSFEASSARGR